MSAPAFTPGPWELKPWQVGTRQWHRAIWAAMAPGYDARGVLAHTMGQRPLSVNAANARLIAAAPELYDALDLFVAEYVELVESGDAGFWDAEKEAKVIKARAALAKARGEQ
jgi:hypothetical protein